MADKLVAGKHLRYILNLMAEKVLVYKAISSIFLMLIVYVTIINNLKISPFSLF